MEEGKDRGWRSSTKEERAEEIVHFMKFGRLFFLAILVINPQASILFSEHCKKTLLHLVILFSEDALLLK